MPQVIPSNWENVSDPSYVAVADIRLFRKWVAYRVKLSGANRARLLDILWVINKWPNNDLWRLAIVKRDGAYQAVGDPQVVNLTPKIENVRSRALNASGNRIALHHQVTRQRLLLILNGGPWLNLQMCLISPGIRATPICCVGAIQWNCCLIQLC